MTQGMIGLLFLSFAGVFSILASIFNWDFYFTDRRARLIVKIAGRTGARVIYGIFGLVLIGLGFYVNTLV